MATLKQVLGRKKGFLTQSFTIDYGKWYLKSGKLVNKLIPFARITAREIAEQSLNIIEQLTPEPGIQYFEGGQRRSTDIGELWDMEHSVMATREEFIIKNTYANQDVILWMEEGTDPHEITPTTGKLLHFWTSKGEVFTPRVSHPGTRPHLMITTAEKWARPRMNWYRKEVFKLASRIMSGRRV